MEPLPIQGSFITTAGGNKMCNNSMKNMSIEGKNSNLFNNIKIEGKNVIEDGTILRGDFDKIKIGLFTILSKDSILRPPPQITQG
jgi:carbonic anhydrase/acetyltransferase-like protein (isoleucine patch superfamily)